MIYRSPDIQTRYELAELCNRQGLLLFAVEVGTERGEFALHFRKHWKGNVLLCIDAWDGGLDGYDELNWERESDYLMTVARFGAHFETGIEVFRGTVQRAFELKRLRWRPQFVYLDSNHQYEHVKWEIDHFWPELTQYGILAGHDYDPEHPGVIRAVNEFARQQGIPVYLTHEVRCRSWYCFRFDKELANAARAVCAGVQPGKPSRDTQGSR